MVQRNSTGEVLRDNGGNVLGGSVAGLSPDEYNFLSVLDGLIDDYTASVGRAGDEEALNQQGRTDWFYDPTNPNVQGSTVAVASHVFPDVNYAADKFKSFNKGRK